ncbi:MAG: biliverdin-producing heme oxygenase [Hyphomonadaceae bacterium]|nr:biliverdin-producing heme oxygenase [Hyphomonadaceae bacterium]
MSDWRTWRYCGQGVLSMYLPEVARGLAVDDRRFALKRATDDAHARVEDIVQRAGMFATREGYLRYLEATFAMRAKYERLLDASAAELVWAEWPARRIAGLVGQDIADLGGVAAPEEYRDGPVSTAELLGVLYVLEGASVGARMLVRSVAEMGLTAEFGARHMFRQAGDRDAWRSFLAMMAAAPEAPCHDAARATFNAFADAYREAAARA